MSSKKIGLAIIGTGMAAKPHALALNELKDDINVVEFFLEIRKKEKIFLKIIILIHFRTLIAFIIILKLTWWISSLLQINA